MEEKKEKALLVGLNITSTARRIDDIDINESMDELKELSKSCRSRSCRKFNSK